METSLFLAKLFGVVFITASVGLLRNNNVKAIMDDFLKSPALIYFGGFLALVFGYLVVSHHNIWETSWRGLITLIGWMMVVKGVCHLVMPGWVVRTKKSLSQGDTVETLLMIMFLVGAYLVYIGCGGTL